MMKCHKMEEYGTACQHFSEEMDKLLAELTSSVLRLEQNLLVAVMPELSTQQKHPVAATTEALEKVG